MIIKTYSLFFVIVLCISCQKNDDTNPEQTSYLNEWLGEYEGTSHHWFSFYNGFEAEITHTYRNICVDVQIGSLDSTLNFTITYDEVDHQSFNDLEFTTLGYYHTQWGSGSSAGSRSIQFRPDSLQYESSSHAGIATRSGIDFNIGRKLQSMIN